jgi:hypothetical protein
MNIKIPLAEYLGITELDKKYAGIKVQGFLYDSFYRMPSLSEEDEKALDALVNTKFFVWSLVIGGNRKLIKFLEEHKAERIL